MEPAELELFKLADEFDCCANELRRRFSHCPRPVHKLPLKLAPFAAVKLLKAYARKVYVYVLSALEELGLRYLYSLCLLLEPRNFGRSTQLARTVTSTIRKTALLIL